MLATGFSVLLGFVVFLAFESYDQSRSGAETGSARALAAGRDRAVSRCTRRHRAHRRAGVLRPIGRPRRMAARGVRRPRATRSTRGESSCSDTFKTVQPQTASEEAAYGKWLDQTSDREAARIDRIHGAVGVIPTPLWVVLLLISVVVFVFMLFFADPGEGAVAQAVLMGSVASVVVVDAAPDLVPRQPVPRGNRRRPSSRDGENASTSSTRRCGLSMHACSCPVTRSGSPSRERGAASATGSRSRPRSCSRLPRSRRPGAATRPHAGTASRRRRRAA